MAYISQLKVGTTTYDIKAKLLTPMSSTTSTSPST